MRPLILAAGIFGALGIAARAFEAHGLVTLHGIDAPRIRDFSSGTEMLLLHALALLGAGALARTMPRTAMIAGIGFAVGPLLFAAPLIAYGLTGARTAMFVTPVGGSLMILAWIALAVGGALSRPLLQRFGE
jgi:uncharacterized membrane protein YgdD (TMEM256/DUF423 family)